MQLEIIGSKIYTEQDFHNQISKIFPIQDYYGNNLDALWDLLSTNVERPITLVWKDAIFSKNQLKSTFIEIIKVLERVKKQDEDYGFEEKFNYILE
ncbi:barstar family protein [Neisseria elongata]|jgi:identified by metaGeneAnnotator|uniref:barstar family protein n=1 Tax=Neisseria elongata TaxID=495 RepID=UPI0009430FE1|nr:barstar family protein [Neisseria elongata]